MRASVSIAVLGALLATGCRADTTAEEDAQRVKFPLRDDFPTGAAGSAPTPGTYQLLADPDRSHLAIQVFAANDTLGHDHVIRAKNWTGSVTFTWPDLSTCSVQLTLPVSELAVDEDDMRTLVGYDDKMSADQRQQVKGHMEAKNQLDAANHKEITFAGSSCVDTGARGAGGHPLINVNGRLTIRGASKDVTLPLEVAASNGTLAARGRLTATHTDFGFQPYLDAGGLFANKDELYFVIDVRGQQQ
ncbi:MAG: YceI family protein [Myxococcota bacterium]